ncbi:MAG: Ltp family lipoprotein [Lutibacter sp.]|nr:Ltp family lipoprotein [Lutibacter sp.]
MSEQITPSKKISVGLILSWIFGVLFALSGIVSVFSEPIPGLVMLIMAAVLLPPVTKLVYQKWKYHLSKGMKIVVIVIGIIIFGSTIDTSSTAKQQDNQPQVQQKQEQFISNIDQQKDEIKPIEEQPKPANNEQPAKTEKIETIPTPEKVEIPEETKSAPVLSETVSQKNAVKSAKAYLNYSAFSYTGLIKQLEYEKFSHADAVYGVDNSNADWFAQAAKSAKAYMEYSAFSRGSLIDQLKYEGFTQAQAEHGADTVGL